MNLQQAANAAAGSSQQKPMAQTMSKQQKKLFNQIMVTGDQEKAEEFNIAMDLLNKYQKDKDFFKKDSQKTKKRIDDLFEDLGVAEGDKTEEEKKQ